MTRSAEGVAVFHALAPGNFVLDRFWSQVPFLGSGRIADVDDDGDLDLLGLRWDSLLLGRSTGLPDEPQLVSLLPRVRAVATVSGGDRTEIVAVGPHESSDARTVVHRGYVTPEGSLVSTAQTLQGPVPNTISVADLDGEGSPEIILQRAGSFVIVQ